MTAADRLEQLREPQCYPHRPAAVDLVQTHLSVVCLAGDLVYKLKKPLRLPFVDFSTLAARRAACRAEVRLNRRLCPDVYLSTAALRATPDGLRFAALHDDDGPADLDVAVVMRRLPQERMLDELLRRGEATAPAIERLARQVAAFHAAAARDPQVRELGAPERLLGFAAANFTELRQVPGHGLPPALLDAAAAASERAFARLLPQLRQRAAAGRVVDGHGDLHARNVCMTEPPAIYDCIEFEPAFRCGDVALENAFLVMDLRYRGAPDLAQAYARAYAAATGDHEQAQLLPVLGSYRAMVRAKVAALAAAAPELPAADRDGARASAHRHLRLAAAYLVEANGPQWLVLSGPPASGKSHLAAALAADCQWPVVATDAVRKLLAGIAPTERARPEHYTAAFSARTYADVAARAAAHTTAGAAVVVLDGNFATPERRAAAAAAAKTAGVVPVVAALAVDAATAQARAAARQQTPGTISDAGPAEAAALHAAYVPPSPAEGPPVLALDGSGAAAATADDLLARWLGATGLPVTDRS